MVNTCGGVECVNLLQMKSRWVSKSWYRHGRYIPGSMCFPMIDFTNGFLQPPLTKRETSQDRSGVYLSFFHRHTL